ncbi:MORC family CW-type zinc finger protein 3 isoform X1 [Hemibagrus wyckioides]|uniref:MORC family CW-type zinc finger protein 3 isoform X1 n=1 Tax=Hemibagrus wyckioides TaxID=337641 RepID=UPI00266BDA58|nr:MORC family CW-type zinc finger protein 3 isoform X1 [Hemibagrus wyckioides]
MARLSEHGIRLSSMSPSYLNSNSTSHTWPFSAVAELIDNASDPGVTAKQIWIDVVTVKEELCLSFTDNGSGMTPSKLHKMLSFGFTEKGSGKGTHQAIGIYGNGFKSGSMRLGRDALIFTKNGGCQSVGMLSQTFLHAIKAQAVIVPIAPFNQQTKSLVITEDSEASLRAILTHSLFQSESELQQQLDSIPGKKGTKILIWNIRRNKDGKPEFDFDADEEDIRLPEIRSEEMEGKAKRRYSAPHRADHIIPEMDYSLRAYLSILYLKPRIQIILRGKKVQTKLVAKSLSMIENDVYKPQFINERVKITFGFNHKNKDHYGIMMYHNNRLIKSYEKVGCQIKSSGLRSGVGVIGVIECNFLKPAHNKQDFEYTKEYRLTMAALGNKLNDYWREKKEKKAKERAFRALERKSVEGNTEDYDESEEEEEEDEKEEEERANVIWLQCDDCMKWRGIPRHLFKNNIPEQFTCSQHPIGRLRSCLVPEEAEEPEDELTPSYEKTHKKQEVWAKRRGKSVESDKGPTHTESKEAPEPTSETTPDETVITIETEAESREDESTPSQNCNKRKATWTDNEISSKSPKRTDSEKEISTTTTESEEEPVEENLEILKTKSKNNQTKKNAKDESKSPAVSPDTESTANPTPSEQQVARTPQTKDQPKLATGPPGWPHPITPHPSMAWSHPLPPAQTVVVPPLSRTSRQPHTVLRLENPDRSVLTSRLDQLEREAKRLRRILGLREAVVQMSPLSDGEVSGSAGSVHDGKTDSGVETVATASVASKKSGPQPDQQSILKRTVSPAGQQEAPVALADDLHWSKTLAKLQSQNQALATELSKVKKENDELQSKLRQTEKETRDKREQSTNTPSSIHDSIALDRLRSIRRNVVSLLSSILPNLDMQGISYDTGDVDSILQQIIQANNL